LEFVVSLKIPTLSTYQNSCFEPDIRSKRRLGVADGLQATV